MAFSTNDPRNYVALSKQDAQRTEGTVFKFLKAMGDTGLDLDLDADQIYETGDGQTYGFAYKRRYDPKAKIEANVRPDMFAYLSAFIMGSGANPPSVADTNIASHLYVPNPTIPFVTIEESWKAGDDIDRVTDSIMSTFQLDFENGKPWDITGNFVGGGTFYFRDGAASGLTPAYEANNPHMFSDTVIVIDGATSLDVQKLTYKFERKVEDGLYTNQLFRRDVVPLTQNVEVTAQVIFQNDTLYKKIMYNSGSMPQTGLPTGSLHLESTSNSNQKLEIDVPFMHYTKVDVEKFDPDGKVMTMNISAMGIKLAGTSLVQHRAQIKGRATSYLAAW